MTRVLAVAVFALVLAAPPRSDTPTERGPGPPTSLAGQLLVATDTLRDPRFRHTVIYVLHHGGSGAMGVVVNRPVGDAPLAAILNEVGVNSAGVSGTVRLHYGGPVEPSRGGVLHPGDSGLTFTTSPAILESIARRKTPARFLFVLGYAGWAPGQLEAEIDAGAWITVPSDTDLVLDDDAATKWERATARRRIRI
jgi:putative transcriptional regulator